MSRVYQIPPIFVEESPNLQYDAVVKNETGRVVRFTGVQRSCSCTAAELGVKELAPGQETKLHFDIDLCHRTGPQRFVCRLLEGTRPEWVYTLETTLYKRAQFAGTGATHFGMADPNADVMRETEFMLFAESPAQLPKEVSFEVVSDRVQVERGPDEVSVKPDGVAVRRTPLKLQLHAPIAPGPGNAAVQATFLQNGTGKPTSGQRGLECPDPLLPPPSARVLREGRSFRFSDSAAGTDRKDR